MKKQLFFFCFCALLFSCTEEKQDINSPGRYTINAQGRVLDTQTGRLYYLEQDSTGSYQYKFIDITPQPGIIPKQLKEPPKKQ